MAMTFSCSRVLALVAAAQAASLSSQATSLSSQAASLSSRGSVLRLRGGADGADDDDDETRKAIHAKLNACPVFCILSGENKPVGVRAEDGSIEMVWFTEPAEVQELFESMLLSDSAIDGLHLGCTPLGDAFEMCGGWDASEAAHAGRKIQGPREVVDRTASALVAQLQAKGIESLWQLPLYCSDAFQSETLMPFFFSEAQLAAGWVRNGRPEEDVPQAPLMMDIRTLVGAMQQDASVRAKAAPVSSPEAYELAREIIAQQASPPAAPAVGEGGGGDDAGGDDQDA